MLVQLSPINSYQLKLFYFENSLYAFQNTYSESLNLNVEVFVHRDGKVWYWKLQ